MGEWLLDGERYDWALSSHLGRSLSANRIASLTSSASKSGKSSRISSTVMPSRTMATTAVTGMRMPRMQGAPPICSGRTVMRGKRTMIVTSCSSFGNIKALSRWWSRASRDSGAHSANMVHEGLSAFRIGSGRFAVHPCVGIPAHRRAMKLAATLLESSDGSHELRLGLDRGPSRAQSSRDVTPSEPSPRNATKKLSGFAALLRFPIPGLDPGRAQRGRSVPTGSESRPGACPTWADRIPATIAVRDSVRGVRGDGPIEALRVWAMVPGGRSRIRQRGRPAQRAERVPTTPRARIDAFANEVFRPGIGSLRSRST